ncbi:hypothetical protein HZS_5988, partial [Henneguya salminicola]
MRSEKNSKRRDRDSSVLPVATCSHIVIPRLKPSNVGVTRLIRDGAGDEYDAPTVWVDAVSSLDTVKETAGLEMAGGRGKCTAPVPGKKSRGVGKKPRRMKGCPAEVGRGSKANSKACPQGDSHPHKIKTQPTEKAAPGRHGTQENKVEASRGVPTSDMVEESRGTSERT